MKVVAHQQLLQTENMKKSSSLCTHCDSSQVIRHGYSRAGKQRYKCRGCGRCFTLNPGSSAYEEATKARILRAYHERTSLRGLTRLFGVSRQTVTSWLKKSPGVAAAGTNAAAGQASSAAGGSGVGCGCPLGGWSFVGRRTHKRWVWLAQCRRTRQIVAYTIGARDDLTCRLLWSRVPARYRFGRLDTDFWESYRNELPVRQHWPVGKEEGQTNHIERFNGALRQRLARFVRKTLSFSKTDEMHEACLQLFLHEHNRNCANNYN